MTNIVGGALSILRGLVEIATAPLRIIAGPFGCLFSGLFSFFVFLVVLFLIFYFVGLQHVGPRVEGERVTITGSNGVQRSHLLTQDGANFFDLAVRLAQGEAEQGQAELALSEREINAKLWSLLRAERAADPDFPIDSLVVVLTPDRVRFYVNGDSIGRTVGVELRVRFELTDDRRVDLAVERVKLGGLPSIPFSKQLADLIFESTALDESFEDALPAGVQDVRVEEGEVVFVLGRP